MDSKILKKHSNTRFSSQRKKQKDKLSFGINSTYLGLLFLIVGLLTYYIITLNTSATRGYEIRDLETQKRNLSIEKEALDAKIAELESTHTIGNEEEISDMEEASNPEYLVIKSNKQYVYKY